MPLTSWEISQAISAQTALFSANTAYAQQLAYPMQARAGMGMPPPSPAMPITPPPSLTSAFMNTGVGGFTPGQFGEQAAASMGSFGRNIALPVGMGALSLAGGMGMLGTAGRFLDPMSAAITAGRAGMAFGGGMTMGGLAMGGLAAGAAMLPAYALGRAVDVYGGAFMGGMQDQVGLNATLRQNFNFMGGSGFMGRGFNTQQMGAIGNVISQELRNNVFTNSQELNGLISGGAQAGMFSGVRDIQQFTQRFREMLGTLRTVQRELGGTLNEALNFVSQSRMSGIFSNTDRTAFAAGIRQTSAVTGLDQAQLLQMSMQGAQLSRSIGGAGRQGAFGALRAASTLGGAISSGAIDETMLSEATGGLTGADAIQAFTSTMMQRTAQFSRRAMGRYSIFALSNREGTGLDQGQLDAFLMGDTSVGDISRRAHGNVARMGRARAINNEGLLRGALLEQGGLSGQIGMMRQVLGDRVLDQGDELSSLVLQRRFRMSRPEAEVMMSLMRNQGNIAVQEAQDSATSDRQSRFQTDVRENRSFDAFMSHLSHGIQEGTGVTRVRELGRTFMTRFSTSIERAMNDLLGIANESMTQEGQRSMGRLRQGRASAQDLSALGFGSGMQAARLNLDSRGLFETGASVGERLRARGMSTAGADTYDEGSNLLRIAREADAGIVTRREDIAGLASLNRDVAGSTRRFVEARLAAMGSGNADDIYRFMGGSGNAVAAFASQQGLQTGARADDLGRLMGRGGGQITAGAVGRDLLRIAGVGAAGLFGSPLGGGAALGAFMDTSGNSFMSSEILRAMRDPQADSLDFIASGGHLASRLRGRDRGQLFGNTTLSDREQGLLSGLTNGVSRESLQGLQGSSEFMQRYRAAISARSPEARRDAMERLTRYAGGIEDQSQGRAAMSLVTQMQDSMDRNNGQFTREQIAFAQSDPSVRAAIQQREEFRGDLSAISRRLIAGGREFQGIARSVSAFGNALGGDDPDRVLSRQDTVRRGMLSLTDDQFREATRMATRDADGRIDAGARALFMGYAQDRQIDRSLRGEGRRRGREASETALGLATGNMFGSLSFEIGGREVHGDRARRMMEQAFSGQARGGFGQEAMVSFRNQLEDRLGLSHEQALEVSGTLAGAYQRRGRDGGFTREDRERITALTSRDDIRQALDQAQEQQRQATLSAASARDPVGAETNRILNGILSAIQNQGGDEGGGPANGSGTGNGATPQ